jgi:adenine-specific DNA-methyltransferase
MLDVETRGSPSLLNVQAFSDPTAYRLKVKRPGSDESCEVNVDLLETFNWLIGLTVRHIAASHRRAAKLHRRVRARQRRAPAPQGPAQAGRRRSLLVPRRDRHHA